MAQTPVSASVEVLQGTTTLYTVPATKTAVVRGIVGGSVIGNTNADYTVNKVSGGVSYPVAITQRSTRLPATGGTNIQSSNLLNAPITLVAGESISIYTAANNAIQIPNISTYSNTTGFTAYINQIVFENNTFIAVGNFNSVNGFILRSTDGINWTQIFVPSFGAINTVAFGGGFWVAVPVAGYNSGRVLVSSNNGVTWSAVAVNGTAFCNTVSYGNSTWVSLWRDGQMFTASTPTSWTVNSNFSNYTHDSGSDNFQCAAWNGTNWIVSGALMGLVYSPDLVTFTSVGCVNFGNYSTGVAAGPISYSSAYARWYATYAKNGTRGIYSSADGRAWTQVITPSFNNLYGVEVAGSNPVLLAQGAGNNGSGNNSAYLKSTDGTTWTQVSDSRGWNGPLDGMANGVFVRFQSNSQSQYYISTDPSTSTGTSVSNSITNFVPSNLAAAVPGGRWIVLCYVSGGTIRTGGGTSNSNINTFFDTNQGTGTYGVPTSITYNPDNNLFYWTTSLGHVFSQANYNSIPTLVVQQFGVGSSKLSIHYFNGFLYLTIDSNVSNLVNVLFASNSNNFGSFGGYIATRNTQNAYYGAQEEYSSVLQQKTFADNGTRLVKLSSRGFTYTTESTSPTTVIYDPAGVMHYQRVNGLDYTYGGQTQTGDQVSGIYEYANITTTRPSIFQSDFSFGSQGATLSGRNNFLTYASSNYYIVASNNSLLFTGPTMATLAGTSVSATSVNGESWVNLSGETEFSTSGSNFYTLTTQNLPANARFQLGFTNNISATVNNSFMTGSIVQID